MSFKHSGQASTDRLPADEAFPFPGYRKYQQAALEEASTALWEEGYDTVVEILPTGVGKSPLNVALCRQARSAFYTTPQTKLRRQLENDSALKNYYEVLRARASYMCGEEPDYDCQECPVNNDPDDSCADQRNCTYWNAKKTAMDADTAVLTFAGLIVDGRLPELVPTGEGERQVSFGDRELLVVDEAHSLADQMASMWAGFTLSAGGLPDDVYRNSIPQDRLVDAIKGREDIWKFEQLEDMFEDVAQVALEYIEKTQAEMPTEDAILNAANSSEAQRLQQERDRAIRTIGRCNEIRRSITTAWEDIESGRPWVVNVAWGPDIDGSPAPKVEVKPVDVDRLLNEQLWNRSEKRVLSTATVPHPNDLDRWMDELGLDPDNAYYVEYPMPFDVENRPVRMQGIDKMSSGGFMENIDTIADAIRGLAKQHSGEKGLVHTVSYQRANELHDRLEDIAVLHDRRERAENPAMDDQAFLDRWQQSDKQVFLSPSCMEGVDLHDEKCRWQVLAKVPYPNLGDARVRYIVRERSDWSWYNGQTSMKILQAVGRGVRNPEDYCDFYVLDESFNDIKRNVNLPTWFTDSIQSG